MFCRKKQETQRLWERRKLDVRREQRGSWEVGVYLSKKINRTWGLTGRQRPGHVESCKA